jgi:hypothetical protein
MTLTVNGGNCASNSYMNKPCVSVTICATDGSGCQTISDLLLDTGSYGLRVFQSEVTAHITPVILAGGNTLAECVQYGDGSSDWGPVGQAQVILAGESAVTVPIQLVNANFTGRPSSCANADQGPADAGFNGILGVGPFAEDCGASCAPLGGNTTTYYSCNGSSTCVGTSAAIANQVTNPISALGVDGNGFILELPAVPSPGSSSVSGYLVLGIGTQSNNQPTGVTKYQTDSSGNFTTNYNGQHLTSFLDSGSNGLFFPAPSSIPDCGSSNSSFAGWLCPSSTLSLDATSVAYGSAPTVDMPFHVGNRIALANSGNSVFNNIGGSTSGIFDWGLPFYLGRNVYEGIENRTSSLGKGPYWAF